MERKLNSLIDWVFDGFRAACLKDQMADLEAQRMALAQKLKASNVPARPHLHPNLPQACRQQLESLGRRWRPVPTA